MALIDEINSLCLRQLGRLPNLESPTGYNDKIQWLKLYDQQESQIVACDKLRARNLVPPENRIPFDVPNNIDPIVLKANHDSGSCFIVSGIDQYQKARDILKSRLCKPYGVGKGEWAYRYITPSMFCEQYVPEANIDYKFHCVHGKVKWIQVIWDRASGKPKETIFTPDGGSNLHMDEKMQHFAGGSYAAFDKKFHDMRDFAETLAAPYRYVRVDLYWAGKPLFGELTFWPRAGCYKSKDEQIFGEMLDIDMSYKYEPICP